MLDGDNQVVEDYQGAGPVAFGDSSVYTKIPGVLTFRGNNFRDAPVYGTTDVTEKKLQVAWTQDTGDVYAEGSHWAGAGWTGQPLLVNWPTATKQAMGLTQAQVDDPNFVEVIYPVVDGNVYRLDLATGAADQAADQHRLRVQGHRLDRSSRLPAALLRHGPERERRQDGRVALPHLRPDPEQGGLRLERDRRRGARATGVPSTPRPWSTRPPTP